MRYHVAAIGASVLLFSSAAMAQAGGHQGHQGQSPPQGTTPKAAPAQMQDAKSAVANGKVIQSTPAFQGYRPYTPDEPLVGWREANDLVLEIGGHVGIMKSAGGQEGTAGAHAGHSKAKPAAGGRK